MPILECKEELCISTWEEFHILFPNITWHHCPCHHIFEEAKGNQCKLCRKWFCRSHQLRFFPTLYLPEEEDNGRSENLCADCNFNKCANASSRRLQLCKNLIHQMDQLLDEMDKCLGSNVAYRAVVHS